MPTLKWTHKSINDRLSPLIQQQAPDKQGILNKVIEAAKSKIAGK